jgi:lipopolysaccharide/colanic/teichoic acid biosynthesis glycosyltransferase
MIEIAGILGKTAFLTICCGVAFYYNDPDDLRIRLGVGACARRLVQAIGLALILLAGLHTVFPDASTEGSGFVAGLLLVGVLIVPLRSVVFGAARRRGPAERVLLLGASELTLRILNEIDRRPDLGYEIVGIIDDDGDATLGGDGRLLGPLAGISAIVAETKARRIIVALAERRGRLPVGELLDCQGHDVVVEDGVHAYERLSGTVPMQWVPPSQLLFSSEFPRSRRYERVAHACTRLLALVALMATAPLFVVIGVAIKLQSRGPVLCVRQRVGLLGSPFRLRTFRTMPLTRVGRWLRALRLDRLPQLINLLRGDMALIGPRPRSVSSTVSFTSSIPYYALRHRVRPGVIGWAQLRDGDLNDDLYYIKHRSLRLDLRILMESMKMLQRSRGVRADVAAQRRLVPGRS